MKTNLLRTARRLWTVDTAPVALNRRNQLEWARAVARLGDKWVMRQPIQKDGGNNGL